MIEKILQTKDNVKIAVNYYCKRREEMIIICPGWFMTKDSKPFLNMSEDLFKYFDIITMDFRGHGKSGGLYTFTAKEELDLSAVVEYAKNECGCKKIYLLGFSLGAAMAIIYPAKYGNINKIIAVSPPSDFYKIENRIYLPRAWVPTLFKKV